MNIFKEKKYLIFGILIDVIICVFAVAILSFYLDDKSVVASNPANISTSNNVSNVLIAVINPNTEVEKIAPVIEDCDMVLLMSVYPGFGGQKFIPEVLPKIEQVAKLVDKIGKDIDIEIDGGINADTIKLVPECDLFVVGSYITSSDDFESRISSLK